MTIGTYLSGTGMEFFKSAPVVAVMVAAEWLCFLLYIRLRLRETGSWRTPVECFGCGAVLLFCNALLQLQFFPIALHCMLQVILWTAFLCAALRLRWHSAVFESSVFCLLLEIGKSLFRGGTFAWMLWQRLPQYGQTQISRLTFLIYLLYMALMILCFRFTKPRGSELPFTGREAAGLLFPLVLYLFIRQFQSGLDGSMPVLLYFSLDVIDMAVAVCMLIVMRVTTSMLRTQTSRNELLCLRLLEEQQHSQYLIQKEALDAVNRKYHDLKHTLTVLETEGGSDAWKEFAREMRREIQPVETICHTGNEALDILLSQRMAQCQASGIRFVPYVDGRNLEWMRVTDLCTLFGNAMDNAVEASMQIPEKERREITLKIERYGSMVIFRCVNCCTGKSMEKDGRFHTTKADAASHGYGLDSIRSIAEKYGGSMTAACENHMFELVILFPGTGMDTGWNDAASHPASDAGNEEKHKRLVRFL